MDPVTKPMHDRLLRAFRREPVDRTPVWFMRQAGRYLPEYRALRQERDVLEMCRVPELAAEATLQPLRRMDVDAAILFSDIMVPVAATGIHVSIHSGVGPIVAEPVRSAADLQRLRDLEPETDVPFVIETIRLLRKELSVPLIGFAGAPFTLASYLIEGGPSRTHERTKALMLSEPRIWEGLMDRLQRSVLAYLAAQVEAGVQAVQVFDSWVGALSPLDYERSILPTMERLFQGIAGLGVPSVHFGLGTGELMPMMRLAGGDVIGVDWRVPLDAAWDRIGQDAGIQGNLDPVVCLAPWPVVEERVIDVLRRAGARPGHVFNLGHGVLPGTPVQTLQRVVDLVHERTAREAW
jgi:uroporphyrinogen decarboxylase